MYFWMCAINWNEKTEMTMEMWFLKKSDSETTYSTLELNYIMSSWWLYKKYIIYINE